MDTGEHLQDINEQLYKQNLELAVKNKTLSLLRELYEISIQSLGSPVLAEKLAGTIRQAFEFEFVAIYKYQAEQDGATGPDHSADSDADSPDVDYGGD